jgi:hypothetical protein
VMQRSHAEPGPCPQVMRQCAAGAAEKLEKNPV